MPQSQDSQEETDQEQPMLANTSWQITTNV